MEGTAHFERDLAVLAEKHGVVAPSWELPCHDERAGKATDLHDRKQLLLRTYYLLSTDPQKCCSAQQLDRIRSLVAEEPGGSFDHSVTFAYPWHGLEQALMSQPNKKINLLGFGSLINPCSAQFDIASTGKPAFTFGFRRLFNYVDLNPQLSAIGCPTEGFRWEHAKLNAIITGQFDDLLNGLCYEIDLEDLLRLREREQGYDLIKAPIVEYREAMDFSGRAPAVKEGYVLVTPSGPRTAQEFYPHIHYLHVCVEGAAQFGPEFVELFARNVYLADGTTPLQYWLNNTLKHLLD